MEVMTIKEVEQELGIPRANIRFYEKKNLLHPERGENTYREYSEEDVATLKKIIILRKIGKRVFLDWFGFADYNGNLNCTIGEAIRGILICCSIFAAILLVGLLILVLLDYLQ